MGSAYTLEWGLIRPHKARNCPDHIVAAKDKEPLETCKLINDIVLCSYFKIVAKPVQFFVVEYS